MKIRFPIYFDLFVIYAHVKDHLNIRANVILTNQSVLTFTDDLQLFHREIHDLQLLKNRHTIHPVLLDLDTTETSSHTGLTRLDFLNK